MHTILSKCYIVPGWNYVKEAYIEDRHSYMLWRDMGKHNHVPVGELMLKLGKKNFCLNIANDVKIWLEQMSWLNPGKLQSLEIVNRLSAT